MNIKEKINMYCSEKNISQADFARSVNESPQNFSAMITGKSRMNINTLLLIKETHPEIDLNRLLDEKENDYCFVVSESPSTYGNNEFKKRLSDDIAKAIQLLERYK